jgi:hypothetical protein
VTLLPVFTVLGVAVSVWQDGFDGATQLFQLWFQVPLLQAYWQEPVVLPEQEPLVAPEGAAESPQLLMVVAEHPPLPEGELTTTEN